MESFEFIKNTITITIIRSAIKPNTALTIALTVKLIRFEEGRS